MGYELNGRGMGFDTRQGQEIFILLTASRPVSGRSRLSNGHQGPIFRVIFRKQAACLTLEIA
jgi:hypothetical protein